MLFSGINWVRVEGGRGYRGWGVRGEAEKESTLKGSGVFEGTWPRKLCERLPGQCVWMLADV